MTRRNISLVEQLQIVLSDRVQESTLALTLQTSSQGQTELSFGGLRQELQTAQDFP